jgi:tRNA (guanosine-2'-O-)-methyltransferase
MGAQKWVDINAFDSISNCEILWKVKAIKSLLQLHDNDCLLEDFDITKPSALFFGTERRFVGRNFTTCWWIPKIPMVGFTESLNISVSAAIIIQNLTNRLRKLISIGIYPKRNFSKTFGLGQKLYQRH